jgi:hypothetical protein
MTAQYSESTLREAWNRSGGRCECRKMNHGHLGRCGRVLSWSRKGISGHSGWEINSKSGGDYASNVEVLCYFCHQNKRFVLPAPLPQM